MSGVPTYVVGAGGVGCEVVSRLHAHEPTDNPFGLLAVDSDPDTLKTLPTDVTTVRLRSGPHFVDDPVDAYPYLAADMRVPAGDARGQRHVGRYKLDNPVGTSFRNHRATIERRIERFYRQRTVDITDRNARRYHLVLVAALGGGTGSGILPLLAAMLDRIGSRLEDNSEIGVRDVRVLGIGIVPPLEFDPGGTAQPVPVSPVSYPNTHAAFRNLSTLLDATPERPVDVRVYSRASGRTGDDRGDGRHGVGPDVALEQPPFDAYWLVGMDHGRGTERWDGDGRTTPGMVARAVRTLCGAAAPDVDHPFQSRISDVPILGALGYGAVTVPHARLQTYCERRDERDRLQRRLKDTVKRNIAELRAERSQLRSALERTAGDRSSDAQWFARLWDHLDAAPEAPSELVDIAPDAIEDGLEAVAVRSDLPTALATAVGFRAWAADEADDVRATAAETCREIREESVVDPAGRSGADGRSESVRDRATTIERELQERIDARRERLRETDPGIRDLLPPIVDAFTSERETFRESLDRLKANRSRVRAARERTETVARLESLADERVRGARERVQSRIQDIDRDLEHFQREKADLQETIEEFDEELGSLRRRLTDPPTAGPTFVCPLRRAALTDVTADALDELATITDYRDRGWLALDDAQFDRLLADCYAYSRSWPDSIGHHDAATSPPSRHEVAVVLYHPGNDSCVTGFLESITEPDILRKSAQPSFEHGTDPFRIEFVSAVHSGRPEHLRGFRRLQELRDAGVFEAFGHPYRDHQRAVAYPEWYDDVDVVPESSDSDGPND